MATSGGSMHGDNPHWFPKTSEWREAVARVEQRRQGELRECLRQLHKAGSVLCADCEDTGWRRVGARVERCPCVKARRLEVIGRRPMPALPEASHASTD
jgi:hypothetical protein